MSRISKNLKIEIIIAEMTAICIEVDGYNAANAHRATCGNSMAYGSDVYFEAAERVRELVEQLKEIKLEIDAKETRGGNFLQ